jgi:hypothetical protein
LRRAERQFSDSPQDFGAAEETIRTIGLRFEL